MKKKISRSTAYAEQMSLYNFIILKKKTMDTDEDLNNSSKTFQINRNLVVFLKVFFCAVSTDHQDFNRGIRGCRTRFFWNAQLLLPEVFCWQFSISPLNIDLQFSHIVKERNEAKSEG